MELLRNITIGQYVSADSLIHKLDARSKIILALLMMVVLFLIKGWFSYLIFLFLVFVVIFLSKIPVGFYLKGLKSIYFLILLTLFFNVLFTKGQVLYTVWIFKITQEGLILGLVMTFRIFMLVLVTSWLTLTTTSIQLTDAIESLLLPFKIFKVPVHELAMMMSIAIRFIPTLLRQTEKIMKAQMARGAEFERGSLIQRAKNLVPVLVPLFVGAFKSADELALAMESRCYQTGVKRTHLRVQRFSLTDGLVFGAVTVVLFVITYLSFNRIHILL